jgi:SAM-dependent methyltransferase
MARTPAETSIKKGQLVMAGGSTIRALVPWWARIGAKIVLSRVPAGYDLWRKMNVFKHGFMHQGDYAVRVFKHHYSKSTLQGKGFTCLEIGPGDSLASAVIAAAYGSTQTYLVDAGSFATSDMNVYREVVNLAQASGLSAPDLSAAHDLDDILRICRASYLTKGLASMRGIPSASVDFIWSNAVLEHIRAHEFAEFMRETRRVLRDDGVCSHQIDLRDHLGGGLNNRRFSSKLWEAEWMAPRSGFYTNRLSKQEMIRDFEAAGFAVDVVADERWEILPIRQSAMAREFQDIEPDELLTKSFAVILRVA